MARVVIEKSKIYLLVNVIIFYFVTSTIIIFAQNFLIRNSFPHSDVTDLHFLELDNSIKNTLWKPHQTVVVNTSGQARDQTAVWDYVLHSLTKTRMVCNKWENYTLYMLSTWFGVLSFRNEIPKLIMVSEFVTKRFHTFKTHILLQDFAIMFELSKCHHIRAFRWNLFRSISSS